MFSPNPVPIAIRGIPVNEVITISRPNANIISVEKLFDDQSIIVNISGSSFTISGMYLSAWKDYFYYVEIGNSDKIQEPTIIEGIENTPECKDMYFLNQDQKHFVIHEYSVTYEYTDESLIVLKDTIIIPHTVENNFEAMRSFMANYTYGSSNRCQQ